MPTSTWRVLSQTSQPQVAPTGGITDGMSIAFITGEGNNGTVWVPMSRYTAANVKEAIAAAAAQLDQIGALTHDTEV